jgi:hypothetical protein
MNIAVKWPVCLLMLVSFAIYLPKMVYMRIVTVGNATIANASLSNQYRIVFLNNSKYSRLANLLSNHSATIPLCAVMILVNVLLLICLTTSIRRVRRSMGTRRRAIQRNTINMVIWIGAINATNQLILILAFVVDFKSYVNRNLSNFLLHFTHIICHSANIIIYYLYDRQFATYLKHMASYSFTCSKSEDESTVVSCLLKRRKKENRS